MRTLDETKGFTLIEVLIAMIILAIGSLGVAGLTVGIIRANVFSNKMTTAVTLAQDKMEDIKRLGYGRAETSQGTEGYRTIRNYPPYKRTTIVSSNTPTLGMTTVTVRVDWDADAHFVALNTVLAQ